MSKRQDPTTIAEQILAEARMAPYGKVCRKALIELAAFLNLRKALNCQHMGVSKSTFGQMPAYRLGNSIIVFRGWHRGESLYGPTHSPGQWLELSGPGFSAHCGKDTLSLLMHLQTREFMLRCCERGEPDLQEAAARYALQMSETDFLVILAERLSIDLISPTLTQRSGHKEWHQAPFASASSPDFRTCRDGLWPDENPFEVPFIGKPHRKFALHDKQGRLQAWLGEWDTTWGEPLQFWFTLWAKDSDPLQQKWAFRRPNLPLPPYGIDIALKHPEATLVIEDDASAVKTGNEKLTSMHASPPVVMLGVPRHASGMSAFDWDFSPLAGRRVLCFGQNDPKSIAHTVDLHKALSNSGVNDIDFVLPRSDRNGETRPRLLHETGDILGRQLDVQEFHDLAERDHGIVPEKHKTTHNEVWRLGKDEIPAARENDAILAPVFPAKSVTLLYAPAGVGKTYFALLLSCAIAGGTTILDGRFRAPQKRKVLYVCSEMANTMATRVTTIVDSLGLSKDQCDLNVWPHPDLQEPTINLESPETWSRLEPYVQQCDFLVLDHLTGLTGGQNDRSSWSKLWAQLKKIRDRGKTILIIHHSAKNGEMRGASNIKDDVDSVISLKEDDEVTNCVRMTCEKHRDDINFGEDLQPFEVLWGGRPQTGKVRWWTRAVDDPGKKKRAELPSVKPEIGKVLRESLDEEPEADAVSLVTMLAENHRIDVGGVLRRDIDAALGCSPSKTRAMIEALEMRGILTKLGHGKATRYKLTDAFAQKLA